MHLLTQAKNNVSGLELRRQLGVNWRTAWRIKHKLMQVMAERESRRQLSGRVEIDDAYLGGERAGKPGRGSPNKIPFVIAVSTVDDGKPHQVVICCAPSTSEAIRDWANTTLSADTHAVSDGLRAFGALRDEVASHRAIVTGSDRAAAEHPQFKWVNTLLGNLKTGINGSTTRSNSPSTHRVIWPTFSTALIDVITCVPYCRHYYGPLARTSAQAG